MPGGPHRGPRPGAPGEPRPEKFRGGKPGGQKTKTPKPKPETPPKPKREKIPPPEPFKPTEEQIAQVEARYKELAVPAEYDGIRTQISKELSIPKTAVKKIIKDFREREQIPSWWELQPYKGSSEELEKIKAIYEPFLPLPPVGVHKQIAEQLSLKPVDVYQAIKVIRQELNLPQYNDPALHGLELAPKGKKKETAEAQAADQQAEAGEAPVAEQQAEVPVEKQQAEAGEAPVAEQQAEAPVAEQQAEVPEVPVENQQTEAAETPVEKQQAEAGEAPVAEQQAETAEVPAKDQVEEKKQESEGEITSIETDTEFHKVGNTTEVGAATATDTNDNTEA
jgi:hypothetical protein